MRFVRTAAVLAATATFTAATMAPAVSAPLRSDASLATATQEGLHDVQWRGHRHWRGHRGHHGWRHRHHGYGWGPALGGLAAGAIIGGAIANSQARSDAVAYCSQRFKSYDPGSGTYLGYDGLRHPCP